MTVVITGAAGHVGGNLARDLLKQGRKVRAVVYRDRRALEGLNVETVNADTSDPDSLVSAFQGATTVFNLAALISIEGSQGGKVERTNIAGVRNVVDACLKNNVGRLVHFSSIHAFRQAPVDQPLDETRPHVDINTALAYDRSKALGEKEVLAGIEKGLDAVIVNPTAVLGPNDFKPSRMGRVLLDLANKKMFGLVEGGFDWVDVRNVVQGAIAAEEKGKTGEKYLLSGHYLSIVDLAKVVEKITGVKAPRIVSPMWLASFGAVFVEAFSKLFGLRPLFTREAMAALRGNRCISNEKARRELGYSARPIETTIADSVEWFKSAGMIQDA